MIDYREILRLDSLRYSRRRISGAVNSSHHTVDATLQAARNAGMQIIELSGVSGSITIDSELQETYSGSTPCNEKMEGEYPLLQPGSNAISWDGNVSSVVVTPNWKTL